MALASFDKLNGISSVLRHPQDGSPALKRPMSWRDGASRRSPPLAILLLTWAEAELSHIEKFTKMHAEVYPEATIIVVRSGIADYFVRSRRAQREMADPAVQVLRQFRDEDILVHVVSNGGANQWCTINEILQDLTGRRLCHATTMIDSGPGCTTVRHTWAAAQAGLPRSWLPRLFARLSFFLLLYLMFLGLLIRPSLDQLIRIRRDMNIGPQTGRQALRGYIYSDCDDVSGPQDVEQHAQDARNRGFAVRLIKFEGSTHVGHLKKDPIKYRDAVSALWQEGFTPSDIAEISIRPKL